MKSRGKNRSRQSARIVAGSIAALPGIQSLPAATLIRDIAPGDGATITDGSGTWSNTAGNWNNGSDTVWASVPPDSAVSGSGRPVVDSAVWEGGSVPLRFVKAEMIGV